MIDILEKTEIKIAKLEVVESLPEINTQQLLKFEVMEGLPEINMQQLLKSEVVEILAEKGMWFSKDFFEFMKDKGINRCRYCTKEITSNGIPDHFILWSSDKHYYIYFHFKCAFKNHTHDLVNDLLSTFNYTYDFTTGRVW